MHQRQVAHLLPLLLLEQQQTQQVTVAGIANCRRQCRCLTC
jgi:hypothetical protein